MSAPLVLLDQPSGRLLRFEGDRGQIAAWEPEEVPGALAALQAALGRGLSAAGYCSYELGYALEPRLRPLLPARRAAPLLWFGLSAAAEEVEAQALMPSGRAYAGPLRPGWDRQAYGPAFARVHGYIGAGDIYQANLSFRARFPFVGDPLALWLALRAEAGARHGAYIDDGARQVLSLSPELFFDLSGAGALRARPMKGTAPRAAGVEADAEARAALAASAKERAENLMIVDLLRNDLGRIAQTGSVAVEDLFTVETYPTLHTMVSTVTARLRPGVGAAQILRALFPCGSVTGAPKIRAMEIIRESEAGPRGIYCGAIGCFAPDGSARFNVAIRTMTVQGGAGELGIGGGVVWDSREGAEYDECLLKARYYEAARKPLTLIETLRHAPEEGFVRLERHLARMAASAALFGLPFDRAMALAALQSAVAAAHEPLRVRLTLAESGAFACTAAPLGAAAARWTFSLSPQRVQSGDLLLRHKTDWRQLQDGEWARAARDEGVDEVLFRNERGELTEGSRSNIFVRREGRLLTPALACGLLDGCLRQDLLARGEAEEAVLTLADLENAEIWLGNSLRGLIRAYPARPS